MYYYTADLHFGHENTRVLCNRPYDTTEQMDEDLISNINAVCKKDDVLMILGDVSCYGNLHGAVSCLQKIKAKKVLIKGNHDSSLLKHRSFRKCFADIVSNEIVRDGKYKIFVSHYPMAEWDGYYKGIWHFYGHVHNSTNGAAALMDLIPTAVNVGVDTNGYLPRTAEELIMERVETYRIPDAKDILNRTVFSKPDNRSDKTLDLSGFGVFSSVS